MLQVPVVIRASGGRASIRSSSSGGSYLDTVQPHDGGDGSVRSFRSTSSTLTSTHMPYDWHSSVSSRGSEVSAQQPDDNRGVRQQGIQVLSDVSGEELVERENMYGQGRGNQRRYYSRSNLEKLKEAFEPPALQSTDIDGSKPFSIVIPHEVEMVHKKNEKSEAVEYHLVDVPPLKSSHKQHYNSTREKCSNVLSRILKMLCGIFTLILCLAVFGFCAVAFPYVIYVMAEASIYTLYGAEFILVANFCLRYRKPICEFFYIVICQ